MGRRIFLIYVWQAGKLRQAGGEGRGGFTLNVILSRYLYFNMETFPMLGWGRKGTR